MIDKYINDLTGDEEEIHDSRLADRSNGAVIAKKGLINTSDSYIGVADSSGLNAYFGMSASGNHGIWSSGYWDINNQKFVSNGKWIFYRDASAGKVHLPGENVVDGNITFGGSVNKTANDGVANLYAVVASSGASVQLGMRSNVQGVYSNGYYDGSKFVSGAKWLVSRDTSGNVTLNGNATSATKATQDGSGNTITSYYCNLSGTQTITGTKTFSAIGGFKFTTLDNTAGRMPVGTFATDGVRCAAIGAVSGGGKVRLQMQNGTAGSSYSNYDVNISSSDIRLKENVSDTEINALDVLNQIKVRQFDWKDRNEHQNIGFIADELEEIDNRLASGGGYDEDGKMNIKTVDTFYLQGYEIKAIQELYGIIKKQQEEIEELKKLIK